MMHGKSASSFFSPFLFLYMVSLRNYMLSESLVNDPRIYVLYAYPVYLRMTQEELIRYMKKNINSSGRINTISWLDFVRASRSFIFSKTCSPTASCLYDHHMLAFRSYTMHLVENTVISYMFLLDCELLLAFE